MVMPLVDLPDAERAMIDILEVAFNDISTDFPDATLTGNATRIQVDQEPSNLDRFPVIEGVPLRLVAHAAPDERTAVKELAGDLLAFACAFTGNSEVSAIFPQGGRSGVSTDPDTKNVMCWVLVRLDLLASLA